MRLYHFCREKNLDSIAEKGLYPHVAYDPRMSLGQEVVWLTTQETTACSEEELQHFREIGEDLCEDVKRDGWLGNGRNHRLTVRIRSGHSKLINYGDFLRLNADTVIIDEDGVALANDDGELYSVRHMMQGLSPTCLRSWFLYFGRIPPSAIEGLPPRINREPKREPRTRNPVLDLALAKALGGAGQWSPEQRR
jgi:hypothetical protein